MLTNPNTVGLFDKNILKITEIVHNCGGLCYYDGANLNAVMGTVCPGDMGFDVIHLNLHKTFSTPHGGGGPGSGPVGCKSMLVPFLPSYVVDGEEELKFVKEPQSIVTGWRMRASCASRCRRGRRSTVSGRGRTAFTITMIMCSTCISTTSFYDSSSTNTNYYSYFYCC